MYKADSAIECTGFQAMAETEQPFSMSQWWYCVRGWLLVQFVYRSSVCAQIRFLARNISARHLEVPIGEGTMLSMILAWRWLCRRSPADITGIDYSRNMVKLGSRRFARNPRIHVEWGDVGHLDFADETFSSVNVPNGFHCFPDPDAALKEIHRILKPGGTYAANILLQPRGLKPSRWLAGKICRRAIRKGELHCVFDLDTLLAMIRKHGFDIREQKVSGNTLYMVASKSS